MRHPLELVALRRLIDLSAQVEVQLTEPPRPNVSDLPVLAILAKAREDAMVAMIALCEVDAENPKEVRRLQNEVARFTDLVQWLRTIVVEGQQADSEMTEIKRDELEKLVLDVDEETLNMLGLNHTGAPSQ